ncbi:hypothetical protein SMB34_16855 [Thalassospira permensis NBRC 106175]|uniref:Uncharacterized protein n=1 Tax=Thalassospira permensis NBRC 106175 TaxID=1353532 RepID=A0ABR4TP99_9PROT|nr:hypothetical protein SMB34_16855 [Thalassospira permensis NBRC 106175]
MPKKGNFILFGTAACDRDSPGLSAGLLFGAQTTYISLGILIFTKIQAIQIAGEF